MRKLLVALVSLSVVIVLGVLFFAPPFSAQELDLNRLHVPAGFHVELFAKVPKARLMTFSPGGTLLVTSTSDGAVYALPDPQHSGKAERLATVAQDLNAPHGIAFYQGKLYVADTDEVLRFDWDEANLKASNPQSVVQLSRGGMHFTRTLLFNNGKMYVASGSDCNVCEEKDPHRAAVTEYTPDGKELRIFASGLRNDVGLSVNPITHTIWGGDNGRDWLGDNLPPEEINDLDGGGKNFGWPYCYGNKLPNPEFKAQGEKICPTTVAPKVEIQAHSAPLGVTFYTGTMFPAEYKNGLFVALHGSWNRSALSGYKVDFIPFGANGEPSGPARDFLTGFVRPGEPKNGPRM
ncbi:MAG TPA: PQQ-dependent sugar dehydrogenase, partial [Terriglobia bacterium]|nr:PQQ-dependent sugar dehydrogenase [Terriglobia bacterium]